MRRRQTRTESMSTALRRIAGQLEAAGVPPLSTWWLEQCDRFYSHPTARTLVACVGRGGDKTRTSVVMAIAEVLAGEFRIAPGERHYFTHVSENRDEAAKTLGVLESYLRILHVPFTRTGDTIELTEQPRGFRVLACRVGAVSGWRCIGWTADECAKWTDEGSDPSAEVIASIRAMTVTHSGARGRMISSPLATLGHFFEAWHAGDTAEQLTAHATSWVANPSIGEEQTRALERDPRKWSREYEAIPQEAHEEALFDPAIVDRATRAQAGDVPPERGVSYLAAMDPSLGRNAWTFVIAGLRMVGGRRKASIVLSKEWRAPKGETLDPAAVLSSIAQLARPYGVSTVLTDQFHAESHATIAARMQLGIAIEVDKPTASERLERYEGTLTRLLDDALELPRDPHVRADLLAVRRRVTAGANAFTITMGVTADGRHADFAPSIVLVCSRLPRDVAARAAYEQKLAQFDAYFGEGLAPERVPFDDAAFYETPTPSAGASQRESPKPRTRVDAIAEAEERNKRIWDEHLQRGGWEPAPDAGDRPATREELRQYQLLCQAGFDRDRAQVLDQMRIVEEGNRRYEQEARAREAEKARQQAIIERMRGQI